ncbi:MAG: PpiC protein [Patescibacteria group bacterium]|nr:PpiC protein [Patescibacteria group bacterium]
MTENEKLVSRRRRAIRRVKTGVRPVVKRFKKPTLRERTETALSTVPRITNDTVAEHRERVLKGARKYKYPLQHSRYKIVVISSTLLVAALGAFLVYTMLNLYKFQATSTLIYKVTQIVPFPVAKAGKNYVSYDDYLFKLRRYMHYYETQQKVDFSTESGLRQLEMQKPRTLEKIINDAYVKQLAKQEDVRISNDDVRHALDVLRIKNQLGEGDQGLRDIASKFFGWSLNDLKREVRQDLLAQKVVQKMDVDARDRADKALAEVRGGKDFAQVVTTYSTDEATKASGGQYNDAAITYMSGEVPTEVIQVLGKMKLGDVSDIIVTPTSYEIVKLLGSENGKYKAAHIQIMYKDISVFLEPLRKTDPPHAYIHFKDVR